ncbi:MAG: nucleotidyltransferase family protein [Ectothiorhodospiraceae bacterium]
MAAGRDSAGWGRLSTDSPEGLLLSCLRTAIASDRNDAAGTWVSESFPWAELLQMGRRHRVLPLLYRGLSRSGCDGVPATVTRELRNICVANTARNRELGAALGRVVRHLEGQGISVLAFKGLPVSLLAYGDENIRQYADLDLLVDESDYSAARHALEALGLERSADWAWECSYVDRAGRVAVDLHRAINPPGFPVALGFDVLRSRALTLVSGTAGRVNTLSVTDTLIVLCLQVVKDGRAHRCVLSKICDIAALVHNRPTLDWEAVLKRSRRLGCRRVVGVGLLLAGELLGTPIPDVLRRDAVGSAPVRGLADAIKADLFPGLWCTPSPLLDERRFYFAARERWRDRIRPYARRWSGAVFRPNHLDRAFVPLPGQLSSLYVAVRPLRLLCDRGRRAWRLLAGGRRL